MERRPISDYVNRPTVYRVYAARGALLYVGMTRNVGQRLADHRRSAPWWSDTLRVSVDHFDTMDAARGAESRAILDENPRHNVIRSGYADEATIAGYVAWESRHRRCQTGSGDFVHGRDVVDCYPAAVPA